MGRWYGGANKVDCSKLAYVQSPERKQRRLSDHRATHTLTPGVREPKLDNQLMLPVFPFSLSDSQRR